MWPQLLAPTQKDAREYCNEVLLTPFNNIFLSVLLNIGQYLGKKTSLTALWSQYEFELINHKNSFKLWQKKK